MRKFITVSIMIAVGLLAHGIANSEEGKMSAEEKAVRATVERMTSAFQSGDIERVMSTSFDSGPRILHLNDQLETLNPERTTMADSTTLIVTAAPNPNEAEAMQAYIEGVLPLLMGAGGKIVKQLLIADVITGEQSYGMVLVMDFESKDALTEMFASDDYKAFIPHRDKGFSNMTISLATEK